MAASKKKRSKSEKFDPGDPALPVAGTGSLAHVKKSKRGPWRAAVLIGVHLLVALHVTHYVTKGETLSPVEPSESMYALELGQVNAGFIFFGVAIISTLIFGRFFCGWGCHIVALQDACGWLLKKMGIRPRPFRSRWLLWLPMGLALYMFVWPTAKRLLGIQPRGFPGWSNHLVTDSFWSTFPGPLFAVLTFLTCGFAAVYFLGAKGFCTYGCPYGAFFGFADRFSPGRIRVTDACEGCGHCTATCTSNVLVHQEVRDFGMVKDPGCMKCMDCVSVCPKDALYFGYGTPAFLAKPLNQGKRSRKSSSKGPWHLLLFREEVVLLLIAVAATWVFRGLYDGPPLLMSAGLGGITAFVLLKLWHLLRKPNTRVQNWVLKSSGAIQPAGATFAVLALLWVGFTLHSGWVQSQRKLGAAAMERTEAGKVDVMTGRHLQQNYSSQHEAATAALRKHFASADRWGLFPVTEVKSGLAWAHLLEGDLEGGLELIGEALDVSPKAERLHQDRIDLLVARGRQAEAAVAVREKMRRIEPTASDHFQLGVLLGMTGDMASALTEFEASVALDPSNQDAQFNLGGLLRRAGRFSEADPVLSKLCDEGIASACVEAALTRRELGDLPSAITLVERAIQLAPDQVESQQYLPRLIADLEQELYGQSEVE